MKRQSRSAQLSHLERIKVLIDDQQVHDILWSGSVDILSQLNNAIPVIL